MPNKQLKQYGLRHQFEYQFELSAENTNKQDTMVPILGNDEAMQTPEDIQVNPYNDNWQGIVSTPYLYPSSVVNNVNIKMLVSVTPSGQETGVQAFMFQSMPILCSFDDIDKTSKNTSRTVGGILELRKEATTEDTIHPIWTGNDLTADTVDASIHGLTTDQTLESVALDQTVLEDEIQNGELSGILKGCTGGIFKNGKMTGGGLREHIIYKDRPYINNMWIKTPGKVKRSNPNTFWGVYFNLPQSGGTRQFWDSDETTAIDHLRIAMRVTFTEYNDMFDQS